MKFNLFFCVIACAGLTGFSQAEVREIKSMREIISSVDPGTLLIFDLDETIINNFTVPISPVEKITPGIIQHFQKKGVKVMGLTARPTQLASLTRKELDFLGVDFSKSIIRKDQWRNSLSLPWLYRYGIEFSGIFGNKGKALVSFLKEMAYQPKRVVMVDNRKKNCVTINRELDQEGIPNVEFRYGAMDRYLKPN